MKGRIDPGRLNPIASFIFEDPNSLERRVETGPRRDVELATHVGERCHGRFLVRDGWGLTARAPEVLYIGRLETEKGVRVLIEAAQAAKQVRTVFAGRGSLAPEIARAAGGGRVDYLGLLEPAGVRAMLDQVSAVVVPSLWDENCPMVVLEAGARGCPVIVSDIGGIPEPVTDGVDGLLVPAGNASRLADAMSSLALDAFFAKSLGAERFQRTRRLHSEEAHYRDLLDVYQAAGGAT